VSVACTSHIQETSEMPLIHAVTNSILGFPTQHPKSNTYTENVDNIKHSSHWYPQFLSETVFNLLNI